MQNKLVILALLGLAVATAADPKPVAAKQAAKPVVHAQKKSKDEADNAIAKDTAKEVKAIEGSGIFNLINSSNSIHEDIRKQARKMDIEPPSVEQIKKNMYVPAAEEIENDGAAVAKLMSEAKVIGGDSGHKDMSASMSEADAACYASRYSDLKDIPAKQHFKTIGAREGRLMTCARELSDYEALAYLQFFPELQQKFGNGPSAIKQARAHFTKTGYSQDHFASKMKDSSKNAWKCGVGAKQSCKCHGNLWYGPTVSPDDKKPIDTWDKMREWKTLSKASDEWMSCTDANFGGDPWKNQEKQCWCEDKPAYRPWKCAEDGEECLCNNGWVVYGAKNGADKTENDFFQTIKLSMAITGTKGKQSVKCDQNTFNGADPAPEADKICFCDAEKKFFDQNFVTATKTFWKSSQLEKQSEGELIRTAEHATEVAKVTLETEASSKESSTSSGVENEKAVTDIASAKACAIQSIEESYKFRKAKITQRRVALQKVITKRRTQVTGWSFQLNVKRNASEAACVAANKKEVSDRARLAGECTRLTDEVNELETQIQVEIEKINTEEKDGMVEITKEETTLESKRTKETITVEEKADEDANEIKEQATEKSLDNAEEKEQLLQQQQELIKIQQKTSHKIEVSIKEQQDAINILVKNLRKKLSKMARQEEIFISELSSDAPERETVVNRIITRSKETITKLTTVKTTLTTKRTNIITQTASLRKEITSLTEILTSMQAKILTSTENLKLKIAERTSKKEILLQYGTAAGSKTPSSESAIVTQGGIDKLTTEIKTLRESIKKSIQSKNESFSTKITIQKTVDLYSNQIKTIEVQIKNLKDFVIEQENTIIGVEAKIKEELATKKVIETQKEAFKAAQKKTDAEEELNTTRIVVEKSKEIATVQSKECKKKLDAETASVKQVVDQLKTIQKAATQSKGTKEETGRLQAESAQVAGNVAEAEKELAESQKDCRTIDNELAKVVQESTTKIAKLTTKIETAKETAETAEREAKATIVTLPGGEKDMAEAASKEKIEETISSSTSSITIVGGSSSSSSKTKTATGKPKTPSVPAPKPKAEDPPKKGEKPKPSPTPVSVTSVQKKVTLLPGEIAEEEDEEDDEPADVVPVEVPGGEAEITKEVTDNTLSAHNARVELVKTKGNLQYELTTIKAQITKYQEGITTTKQTITQQTALLQVEQAKLETMKTSSIVAKMKDNSGKIELEIGAQVTKITEIESTITRNQASLIEFKMKITTLNERRKEIKYTIEIKVLEAKEAESAVLEAIKTVTDVELLSRKRWIASTSVSDYKKCSKFMAEYKMIFEKQGAVIAAELNDHARRIEVAQGAMTSLKEKQTLLKDAKATKDLEIQLAKIASEIERHTKVVTVEEKVIAAVKGKKDTNLKEYETHVDACDKTKSAANVATAAVNDAATTLKNQREYQVQITNLKNILVGSHEQALAKRHEVELLAQNYTRMVAKYEEQTIVTTEQIMESKTRISGAAEIQRIIQIRQKEVETLLARVTITAGEKTKLTSEQTEIKAKIEAQQNVIDIETKNLVTYETSLTTLSTTIKTFKGYIKEVTTVKKELEKKVSETKSALRAPKKKDDSAPPVKGKDTEDSTAGDLDEDGDEKIDNVDEQSEETDAVKGGNERIDKELDQVEEENKSTSTQIDSLTKTITTVQEKSEISQKEIIQETVDTANEDFQIALVLAEKKRLERVRERQRCGRLFPAVFSSFKIKNELTQENMCPCPASGKGLTQLYLENIKDAAEFDKFVLGLFEKNLALEGTFESQLRRYNMGADDKMGEDTTESTRLRLVVGDDKIDQVMQILDGQNLSMKSTDFKISPLLKGKTDYLKWQQTSLASRNASGRVHLGGELLDEEEMDEELPEE